MSKLTRSGKRLFPLVGVGIALGGYAGARLATATTVTGKLRSFGEFARAPLALAMQHCLALNVFSAMVWLGLVTIVARERKKLLAAMD